MNDPTSKHIPRKRFGQHFLHERHYVDRIIAALDHDHGLRTVEIGPGEGALTFPLLQRIAELTAIEIDRDLVPWLREQASAFGKLDVIEADVLNVDFARFADRGQFQLVGNLPYNVSTPLLFHVLDHAEHIERMVFMLQKEVVDRMAAVPGSKTYGRLSVMLQARCDVEPLFDVPPGAFNPPPKVDSAVVRLWPKRQDAIGMHDPVMFERVVRMAFAQRRKTMRNTLRGLCSDAQMQAAGIAPEARAETISVDAFLRLSNQLAAGSDSNHA